MIYVDRKRVPIPEALLSAKAKQAQEDAKKFFTQERAIRAQERFKFPVEILQRTKAALTQLFHGKCAFCESSVATIAPTDVEHFRPRREALGLDGVSAPDHYWWLVLDWDNLYLACQVCSQVYKRNFFPIAGPRGEFPSKGEALSSENALLIDPCRDRPERYLRFRKDGLVESRIPTETDRKRFQGHNRGQITIELLGLNRDELQNARRRALDPILVLWRTLHSPVAEPIRERTLAVLRQAILPSVEYAGAVRQVIAQHIEELPQPQPAWLEPLYKDLESERKVERQEVDRLSAPDSKQVVRRPTKIRGIGYIKNIHIRNFGILDDFELALEPEALAKNRSGGDFSPAEVGWKVLLGENAVGKSTVLKALALALIGQKGAERMLQRLELIPADLLRRRSSEGSICLTLNNEPGTIEVRFDKKSLQFVQGAAGVNTMVRAYGATRLLPRKEKAKLSSRLPLHDIKNLFDPYARLTDADAWLGRTDVTSDEDFRDACITLKDLLAIDDDIKRAKGRLIVDVGSGPVSLERLSSGYQASLALAIDLMRAIPNLYDKQQATGIVLVDEIDAHLHPRWKMDIVRRLRKAFPGIQFIATTHEPLCLRGLRKGEIAVIRRHENSISVLRDLPSPQGLRVDQLLLSPFFGLDSTIDPDLDETLKLYYALLAKPEDTLMPEQKEQLAKLKSRIPRGGVLGYTRRDQLAYEAIDEHLAQVLTLKDEVAIQRLREETKQKIAELWRGVRDYRSLEPAP